MSGVLDGIDGPFNACCYRESCIATQATVDTLRAQLEAAEADAARWKFIKAWGRQIEVVSTGECTFGISTPTWRGTWFDLDAAIDAARTETKA